VEPNWPRINADAANQQCCFEFQCSYSFQIGVHPRASPASLDIAPAKGMFTITKAVSEDFERVYPLFQGFEDAPIPKDDWKKIFDIPWHTKEDFCGYLLLKDGEIKGYLGVIFSRRELQGKIEKFGNMTSWIVTEDCRGQSILLLLELLKLKDYTLTNFTASETVAAILRKLGFEEFSVDQQVLLPVPAFRLPRRDFSCDVDVQEIRRNLTGADLKIFEDHQQLNCQHLLLHSAHGDCYLVLKKTRRKNLSFAKVHYLSNAEVFHQSIESLITTICVRLRVFGLMVDERYIPGQQFRRARHYPHQRKGYFKSPTIRDSNLIDTLYSELVILHN